MRIAFHFSTSLTQKLNMLIIYEFQTFPSDRTIFLFRPTSDITVDRNVKHGGYRQAELAWRPVAGVIRLLNGGVRFQRDIRQGNRRVCVRAATCSAGHA